VKIVGGNTAHVYGFDTAGLGRQESPIDGP
jgi:hypothetical protein